MVIADTLILLTYTVLGAVLCLLLLMVVQYQYGSVGNLWNRWTMREFRHMPRYHKTVAVAEEPVPIPVSAESVPALSKNKSISASVEPLHEILQMKPIIHSSTAKLAIGATALSPRSSHDSPRQQSPSSPPFRTLFARNVQKNAVQNPIIQKMKQLYGVSG